MFWIFFILEYLHKHNDIFCEMFYLINLFIGFVSCLSLQSGLLGIGPKTNFEIHFMFHNALYHIA